MNKRENSTKANGRERAIEKIAVHILQNGLPQTSLRQLAAAAEISDRMLLYYFKDKNDVLTTVLSALAAALSDSLEQTISTEIALPASVLFEKIVSLIRNPKLRPYLHLGIELSASAVRGAEPFTTISKQVADGYMQWIEARLSVAGAHERRSYAAMILGLIDGLAIISIVGKEGEFDMAVEAAVQTLAKS